jgi:hypothetical protein
MEAWFEPLLKPGEKILWYGMPRQGLLIRDADMLAVPMSIMLLGFTLLIDFFAVTNPNLFTVASAVLFSGLFVYLGVLRFFTAANRRKRIHYCITTRRVIVMRGKKRALSTLPLRNIQRAEVTAEKDGSGYISFGNTNPVFPWLFGTFYSTSDQIAGLELIIDVEIVYAVLTAQLQSLVSPTVKEELMPGEDDLN